MAQAIVKKYHQMVARKAWQCWYRLPPQTRTWISVEDLIQDGLTHLHYHVNKRFDPDRSSLTTFVWVCLEHFFKGYTDFHFMKKRFDGRTVPIREILGAESVPEFDSECNAVENLLKVYAQSSPTLRLYLEQWFVKTRFGRKTTKGSRFDELREEFLVVAGSVGLSRDECRFLLYSETWQKRLPKDWRHLCNVELSKIHTDTLRCTQHQQIGRKSYPASSVTRSSQSRMSSRESSFHQRWSVSVATGLGKSSLTGSGASGKPQSLSKTTHSTATTQVRVPLAGRNVRTARSANSL